MWDRLVRVWIVKAVCSVEATGQSTRQSTGQSTGEPILPFHHAGVVLGLVMQSNTI